MSQKLFVIFTLEFVRMTTMLIANRGFKMDYDIINKIFAEICKREGLELDDDEAFEFYNIGCASCKMLGRVPTISEVEMWLNIYLMSLDSMRPKFVELQEKLEEISEKYKEIEHLCGEHKDDDAIVVASNDVVLSTIGSESDEAEYDDEYDDSILSQASTRPSTPRNIEPERIETEPDFVEESDMRIEIVDAVAMAQVA